MTEEVNALTSGKVAVINLNPGVVRHEFLCSMLNLMAYDIAHNHRIGWIQPAIAGGVMDIYRNIAMERFLLTDCEYAMLFDSDMEFEGDVIDLLLPHCNEDTPVVSGLYMMAMNEGVRPSMMYRIPDENGKIRMTAANTASVPLDSLVPVDGCGAGILMIHRSILLTMLDKFGSPQPWFANEIYDDIIYGEDYTFCMRVAEMGKQVYVHTGVQAGHVKNNVLHFQNEVQNADTSSS